MWTQSIGEDAAIALAKSGWWKDISSRDVVRFQLFTEELCMDFKDFHTAIEDVLKRGVFTHEFAFADNLRAEFLGDAPAPTIEEIMNSIPAEKLVVIAVPTERDL